MFHAKQTKFELFYGRKNTKKCFKNVQRANLARKFNDMSIVFNSNHTNTIIYTKQYSVPCFLPDKPCLNTFMRESAKNNKNAT